MEDLSLLRLIFVHALIPFYLKLEIDDQQNQNSYFQFPLEFQNELWQDCQDMNPKNYDDWEHHREALLWQKDFMQKRLRVLVLDIDFWLIFQDYAQINGVLECENQVNSSHHHLVKWYLVGLVEKTGRNVNEKPGHYHPADIIRH